MIIDKQVLIFAKLSGHFTRCFEGQVHQVPYLCTGEAWRTSATFPGKTGVLFHIHVRNLYAKDILKEKLLPSLCVAFCMVFLGNRSRWECQEAQK